MCSGLPSIDLWAAEQDLAIDDWHRLATVATRLLDRGSLRIFSNVPLEIPEQFIRTDSPATADLIVTNAALAHEEGRRKAALFLRPKNLVAGVGCNSKTRSEEIEEVVKIALDKAGLSFLSLKGIATIDIKAHEPGLVAFALKFNLPLDTFTPEELNRVPDVKPSDAARKATGAQAVAEPAAIMGSNGGRLLAHKLKKGNVTVAVAEAGRVVLSTGVNSKAAERGQIYVVGTGPGSADDITPRALKAIRASDAIVGYGPYLELVKELTRGKEVVSTGMAQEIDRCRKAIQLARDNRIVSIISGGDPGIYAMAGLVLELLCKEQTSAPAGPPVTIIPGVSALNACAARLGAPLMHDFAVISLSDRLTAWETIEKRLDAAARADFVIVLYNPKSKGRRTHINRAQQIILNHRAPGTPVGIVRSATREQEKIFVTDLGHMPFDEIDMKTTVIIGNSRSILWKNLMITPRGYENKDSW